MSSPYQWGSSFAAEQPEQHRRSAARRRWVLRNTQTGDYFSEPYGPDSKEWTPDIWLAYKFVTFERASSGASVFWALHGIPLSIDEYSGQELPSHD